MSKEEEITETGNGSGEEELSTDKLFEQVYTAFKLHFYRDVFGNFGNREATLTTVEAFCMEVIYAMKNPTINEFADFIKISSPNAAYKVNNLVSKGYLKKVQSKKDKRRYYLQVTQKYIDYYSVSSVYVKNVMDRLKQDMTPEEMEHFRNDLILIHKEQMKDIPDYILNHNIDLNCNNKLDTLR